MRKVICRLNILMAEKDIKTISELRRRTGISRRTLTKLYNNESAGAATETLVNLCKVLDCGIGDLLELVDEEEHKRITSNIQKRYENMRKGVVYLLRDKDLGLVKIGRTSELDKRIKSLEYEYKATLEVLLTIPSDNTVELEKDIHAMFSDYRFEGEWFRLNHEDIERLKMEGLGATNTLTRD